MNRLKLMAAVALSASAMLTYPAAAQHVHQRSGTYSGGPAAYGAPGELKPGEKPRTVKRKHVHQRSGTYAGGPRAYGAPGELKPGESPRDAGRISRHKHVPTGTSAGGPGRLGRPGEVSR